MCSMGSVSREVKSEMEDYDGEREEYDDPVQNNVNVNLEEVIDEGLLEQNSAWNRRKKYIETRPKNWLARFTSDYSPIAIPPPSKTPPPVESHQKVVMLYEPEKPIIYKVDELKQFNDTTLQSNFCMICWTLVIIGPTRVKCLHCPVVVHRYCVTNISDFFVKDSPEKSLSTPKSTSSLILKKDIARNALKKNLVDINLNPIATNTDLEDPLTTPTSFPALKPTTAFRRERAGKPKPKTISSPSNRSRKSSRSQDDSLPLLSPGSRLSHSTHVDTRCDETTRDVRWICPFCIHEVNVGNDFHSRKYTRLLALHRAKKAVIQIQSIMRMYPRRKKFIMMCKACRTIQRFHRSRNFRRALIKERTNQRRAVRIRLHELTLYLMDSNQTIIPTLPDTVPRVLGQFGANMFPRNLFETPPLSVKHVSENALNSIFSGSAERRQQQGATISKKMVMIDLIRASTVGSSPLQLQLPVKDMNGAPFPPKSLFLTVTTSRMEGGQVNQLYRVDVPMRDIALDREGFHDYAHDHDLHKKTTTSSPTSRQASASSPDSHQSRSENREFPGTPIAYFEIIDEVSKMIEGDSLAHFGPDLIKLKIYPPKPMILFPALPANVRINFTVSEVTEWPRSRLVGQTSIQGDNWLIWRQVATISQGLVPISDDELPKPDSHSRLQIHLWNPNSVDTEPTNSISKPKKTQESDSNASKKSNHAKSKHKSHQYVGGRILWSLIPSSFISSIAGALFFLPQPSIASAKKRCWCVVLDGCMIVYSHITDIRTKEIIDLTLCHLYMLEGEVMKIYRPKTDGIRGLDQSWFCFCAVPNLREEWFKVIKENCANSKRRNFSRGAFVQPQSS